MAEYIAKTFMGLEPLLAEELTALGANDIEIGRRMVRFTGDKELMYRANFFLRTALRILKPIKLFNAKNPDDVYAAVKAMDWGEMLSERKSFAVDTVVYSEEFTHSKFVAYRVKDAIVDWFQEKGMERPNVSLTNPDLRLHLHIAGTECTLALDSSGESLHKRGYRADAVDAPMNEVLAAGIILMTGWRGECDFIDPMCGSGTFLIEAALIAKNIAPGVFRKGFAFEKWNDFDEELFAKIYNDDSMEREFNHKIYGYDIDPKAVGIARGNVKMAGLTCDIELKLQNFADFQKPEEKAVMVMNPPYGERISTNNLLDTYTMIGERLKNAFGGNEAWIITYRKECFDAIGLKPSVKHALYNGALECELRKYVLFDGKMKNFIKEGNAVKTDRERKEMAQYKPKMKREDESKPSAWKQRKMDIASNEEADILSFTFHKPARDTQKTDSRKPKSDSRKPKSDSRKPKFDSRKPKFDSRKPKSDSRKSKPTRKPQNKKA